MIRRWSAILFLLAATLPLSAVPETIEERVDRLLETHKLTKADVGIALYSEKDRAMIFERNADTLMIPASNMKLLTTAAALLKLTPEHEFTTTFGRQGNINGAGVLNGDLIVEGGGDPNISGRFHDDDPTAVFKGWADELRKLGIKSVTGGILLVPSIFDDVERHPAWKEYGSTEWWTAPVCGLSLNDNCVDITVQGAKAAGKRPAIKCVPQTDAARVVNKAETVAAKKKWAITFDRDKEGNIVVDGTIGVSKSTSFSASVAHPALFFGTVLKETLKQKGIEVKGEAVVSADNDDFVTVATHKSGLAPTIAVANRNSQNFYAESILKYLGAKFGKEGSFAEGAAVVRDTLGDVGIEGFKIDDGSGLSKENRVSARQFCDVLKYMRAHKFGDDYADSLAVGGGTTGTLRKRMKEKEFAGRVRAKSGHLEGITCLSGYLETESGETILFSILINGITTERWRGDRFQEDLLRSLLAR